MLEANKAIELNDEELEKVSGGADYVEGVHKVIGFSFYLYPTSMVYKITEVVEFVSGECGYSYKIHMYDSGVDTYVGTLFDYQIDNLVRLYGKPE